MIMKNILGTTATRVLNALFNLFALLMITRLMGREMLGQISLILVDVTVIQLLVDFLAGSALVYFASRMEISKLILPAYFWILLIVVCIVFITRIVFNYFPAFESAIIPVGFASWILILALLNGFMQTHYNLLLGYNRIKAYNIIFTLQIVVFIAIFAFLMLAEKEHSVLSYVLSLGVSWAVSSLLGFISLTKNMKGFSFRFWNDEVKQIFHYGSMTQGANILHLGNKRFSYYLLRILDGFAPLGLFSAAVQLTEGLRLAGQSISLVQFSSISNSRDEDYSKNLTIKSMKFSLMLTLSGLIVLICIPVQTYGAVFGKNFGEIRWIVLALSPGILALAASNIFSHYFSGTGNPKINLLSNLTGFVVMLISAFSLIPVYGYMGAAVTASLSYSASAVHQYIIFRKQTQTVLDEWYLKKEDVTSFVKTIRKLFQTN
ncbi:MAG: oligosaccharide flippase family protein [Bacteroidales bacterium]|nr:oligosaccharide flippase family protein [Bacteroidales bacterium]